jgi:hypothetical protein
MSSERTNVPCPCKSGATLSGVGDAFLPRTVVIEERISGIVACVDHSNFCALFLCVMSEAFTQISDKSRLVNGFKPRFGHTV